MTNCEWVVEDNKLVLIPACTGSAHRTFYSCGCEVSAENALKAKLATLHKLGKLKANDKCCSKCAFRKGSPERSDLYGWLALCEGIKDGRVFACHEGIPDHDDEVEGSELRLCTGANLSKDVSIDKLIRLVIGR